MFSCHCCVALGVGEGGKGRGLCESPAYGVAATVVTSGVLTTGLSDGQTPVYIEGEGASLPCTGKYCSAFAAAAVIQPLFISCANYFLI